MTSPSTEAVDHDVVVIGAGFAGVYLVHKLRDRLGLRVRGFERGEDVGGTWYWNRYPGARCDFEIRFYSYSFDEDLQQEWDWTERYAAQPEILATSTCRRPLRDAKDSQLRTPGHSARLRQARDVWTVNDRRRRDAHRARSWSRRPGTCRAVGPGFAASRVSRADLPHRGWPHEGVDFTGKRVAVIGTGSSGIQAIPIIAQQAAHLTVFQRTAKFSVPALERALQDHERRATKPNYASPARRPRTRGGIRPRAGHRRLPDRRPRGRSGRAGAALAGRGVSVTATLSDTLLSEEANEFVADFVRDKIHQTVKDPATAALLEPRDYPIGTKRLALDTDYYETFNRPNVSLVSVRETPISRFTERRAPWATASTRSTRSSSRPGSTR